MEDDTAGGQVADKWRTSGGACALRLSVLVVVVVMVVVVVFDEDFYDCIPMLDSRSIGDSI